MGFMDNVVINIYSIVILIIIYFNSSKQDEKESLQQKLYMVILQLTMLMLVIDIFSRFDGKPDSIYQAINHFGNFVMFLLNPIVPSLWLLYVHYQTFQEENKIRELIYPLLLINVINVCSYSNNRGQSLIFIVIKISGLPSPILFYAVFDSGCFVYSRCATPRMIPHGDIFPTVFFII
jgi:NADH:ubiquinone oxidoreductase subunit 2 (subunit N)